MQAMNTSGKQNRYLRKRTLLLQKTQKTRNKFQAAARGRLLGIKRAVSSGAASSSEQGDQTQTLKALLYTPWHQG